MRKNFILEFYEPPPKYEDAIKVSLPGVHKDSTIITVEQENNRRN